MLDRVTGIQVFLKVAATGSLTAAARAMFMSPTMATKHVGALEERLGVKLLYRTTRKVGLTEAGRRFLEGAERIISELEELETATSTDSFTVKGVLRVSVPVSFGVREVAPLMHEFSKLHPQLTLDLGLSDRVVDLIEEGWDMAVRIGRLTSSNLMARRLAPCKTVVCAAPAYIEQHGMPTDILELKEHKCLGYTLSRALGAESWSFGKTASITVPITCSLRANNGDALVAAAIQGQGITYQPTFMVADAIATGALVPITFKEGPLEIHDIFAVYPPNKRPPAKVRALIDFLVTRFSRPSWDRRIGND